jgi:hypothetical protein
LHGANIESEFELGGKELKTSGGLCKRNGISFLKASVRVFKKSSNSGFSDLRFKVKSIFVKGKKKASV